MPRGAGQRLEGGEQGWVCRQSRAAEMWPLCAWAALGVGEKEGEEAAEAAKLL